MAKAPAKRPATKTVTLSTGTKVTGTEAVIEKIQARDKGSKPAAAKS